MANKRNIIITEEAERAYIEEILSEAFTPSAEKVKMVADYLSKNFAKTAIQDIDDDGYPTSTPAVNMLNNNAPVKTLNMSQLLMLLDDKFHKTISDDKDRKKFLKQIIKDWFNGKISKEGMLSVNQL